MPPCSIFLPPEHTCSAGEPSAPWSSWHRGHQPWYNQRFPQRSPVLPLSLVPLVMDTGHFCHLCFLLFCLVLSYTAISIRASCPALLPWLWRVSARLCCAELHHAGAGRCARTTVGLHGNIGLTPDMELLSCCGWNRLSLATEVRWVCIFYTMGFYPVTLKYDWM